MKSCYRSNASASSEAMDELLANASMEFLQTESFIKEFMSENSSMAEKVWNAHKEVIAKFKVIIQGLNLDSSNQWLRDLDVLKEAEALWMKAAKACKGVEVGKSGEVKFSLADETELTEAQRESVSYDVLVDKPDMKVVRIKKENASVKDRKEIISIGLKNAQEKGKVDGTLTTVYVPDVDSDIVIGERAARHGLMRNFEATALVTQQLGEYLNGAIRENYLKPSTKKNSIGGYVLLGYGELDGVGYPAYFVVDRLKSGEDVLVSFDRLYSIKGNKTGGSAQSSRGFKVPLPPNISVKDLLELVNAEYSDGKPRQSYPFFYILLKNLSS